MTKAKRTYHHGNLRDSLIEQASAMVTNDGIDALSMRKLADAVGVSRTALYHHFKDKNALLCAIAEFGFANWSAESERIFNQKDVTDKDKIREFIHGYINYAADNPQLYELMFGRTIWKNATPSDSLKAIAYPSFQHQVDMTRRWQQLGYMPADENTLRLAQVIWGTLHGIARLLIDGIYADRTHLAEMCDCVVNLFCLPTRNQN